MGSRISNKRMDHGVFSLAITSALFIIIIDAFVNSVFFSDASFMEQLIYPSGYEIYFRAIIFLTCVTYGFITSNIVMRLKINEKELKDLNAKLAKKNKELLDFNEFKSIKNEELQKEIEKTKAEIRKKEKYLLHIEQLNQFMIDREMKMVDLKKEINHLLKELKREPKYYVNVEKF
ncbi:MAG: hypothetical protein ACE5D7_05435 [Fidelibacterota bacterium]